MQRLVPLLIALCVTAPTLSFAGDIDQKIALYGVGADSCGALVQAWAEGPPSVGVQHEGRIFSAKSNLYMQWLSGFISSVNSFRQDGDVANGTDIEGLFSAEFVTQAHRQKKLH